MRRATVDAVPAQDDYLIRFLCSRWCLAAVSLACVLVWAAAASMPDDDVRITFFDVGEGDAVLIRTPSYKVLVDGGPSPQAISRRLGETLPFWDRRIDLLISTHEHEDHLAGLVEVARRYEIGAVIAGPYEHDSALSRQWRALIQEKGIRYLLAKKGQEIRLGHRARLEVIHPGGRLLHGTGSDANNNSVVVRLVSGPVTVLLAADVEASGQPDILAGDSDLSSLVLKVPHQGARNALGERILDRVRPTIAVISTGKENPFGHPDAQTIEKLHPARIYRTDIHGTIEIRTDGQEYSISGSRLGTETR